MTLKALKTIIRSYSKSNQKRIFQIARKIKEKQSNDKFAVSREQMDSYDYYLVKDTPLYVKATDIQILSGVAFFLEPMRPAIRRKRSLK